MAGSKKAERATWCGFDLSTTGLALGVRSKSGKEAYAHTPIRGATRWRGQPAFKLEQVPQMLLTLLATLEKHGWEFRKPFVSFAVRQHDMVLLGKKNQLLMPALSWQCNAATEQTRGLIGRGADRQVGRIEPRFILPKLAWVLMEDPGLKKELTQVMTTGDWIAERLTGRARLSTSDAISNGLLDQKSKRLAEAAIRKAKLQPKWFPRVLQSGRNVGRVSGHPSTGSEPGWQEVCNRLYGGQLIASLGDNHATGVGCGLIEGDYSTIVISAGTSGTINRVCPPKATLAGEAACFEFYKDRMLLMMLADCCSWYDTFVDRHARSYADQLDQLNQQVAKADLAMLRRVLPGPGGGQGPPNWRSLSVGERAASVQASIMLELMQLASKMIHEAPDAGPIKRFVLTGGLSQSRFFQQAFSCAVERLVPGAKAEINDRKGPLRFQTAAYGGLINAMRSKDFARAASLCPTRPAASAPSRREAYLDYFFRSCGLARLSS